MILVLTKISILLTAIFAFSMGAYTLFRNHKARVNQLWFLTSMAVTLWAASGYAILYTANDNIGKFSVQFTFVCAAFIAIFFLHFVASFIFQDKKKKILILIGYVLVLLFIILIFRSTLVLSDFDYSVMFGYFAIPGNLFFLYLLFFFVYVVYSFYLLIKAYKTSDGLRRKQIMYIVVGSGIGFIGGSTGFLINLFHIFPYGWLVEFLYPILITYAIFLKKY